MEPDTQSPVAEPHVIPDGGQVELNVTGGIDGASPPICTPLQVGEVTESTTPRLTYP